MDVQDRSEFNERHKTIVYQVVAEVLKEECFNGNGEISISIVDDEEIRDINKKYRGIDKATDVLSFPLHDRLHLLEIEKDMDVALGDIVISMERVMAQAEEYGHSIEREVGFLTAHGMLHLLGYDHMTEDDEKVMFSKQERVLQGIALARM